MGTDSKAKARRILDASGVPGKAIYVIGTFDTGVTVRSQQTRALNLVWALIEGSVVRTLAPEEERSPDPKFKIAIVGGGFAGLSAAAGLLRKGADAEITVFEQCDTLLPLQHGSDTRWLHPHIYNWPAEGSEASAAMLPVLNWTAARASDVVVQVMAEWKRVIEASSARKPSLYCNTRHLHIHEPAGGKRVQIEWIGEKRDPGTGTTGQNYGGAVGKTGDFDLVVLAVGFGLETGGALSYWRNDTIGQPSLEQPRLTYLVSGQGDGAMVDLLRLRISHYRQDRILGELFGGLEPLLKTIKQVYEDYERNQKSGIFEAFERMRSGAESAFDNVLDVLARRLRRDTDVILHLKLRKLSDLFEYKNTKISFQNKLLVYLLYKCGGFVPSNAKVKTIVQQHAIPDFRVVRRHGTDCGAHLMTILSDSLFAEIQKRRDGANPDPFLQSDRAEWPGGYFGFKGSTSAGESADPESSIRLIWRKEYLPGPTALVATTFCASLAGMLRRHHPENECLRVTLHRAVSFGVEESLQQCCGYFGLNIDPSQESTAARTFPARNATIGLAYRCRRIVRSLQGVQPEELERAMESLHLHTASSKMSPRVRFLIAIPILEPEEVMKFMGPNPVAGIVYVDSTAASFFIEGDLLNEVISLIDGFALGLEQVPSSAVNRIINLPLTAPGRDVPVAESLPSDVAYAFELVPGRLPATTKAFQLNFEYTDFMPVGA